MSKPEESLNELFLQKPYSGRVNCLGLGVFDGLHRAHNSIANQCDCLMTFYPHPDLVLGRIKSSSYITTLEELTALFPHLAVLNFTEQISRMDPLDFLEKIVKTWFSPKKIVVGYDYKFGHKGQGDTNFLMDWGKRNDIGIIVMPPFEYNQKLVKSGLVRHLIQNGEFNQAVDYLGHPYLLFGDVIEGNKIGRTLGFPTANLKVPEEKLIPQNGVYAGETLLNGQLYKAAVHIGTKPTFNDDQPSIEAHIIDFEGDLYGQTLKLCLNYKIRSVRAFPNKEALIVQIKQDVEDSRGN